MLNSKPTHDPLVLTFSKDVLDAEVFNLKARFEEASGDAHGVIDGGDFCLTKIAVEPTGEKYGRKMINRLIEAAEKKGCTHFVFQGVDKTNTRAIKLYTLEYGAQAVNANMPKSDYRLVLEGRKPSPQ